MAEINIKLTERQARYVLLEMERIAENSDDAGYRHIAEDICRRIRKSSSRPTLREADDLPACLCPADGMPNAFCPLHGAVASGHGLR